jgi:hypothetical protein
MFRIFKKKRRFSLTFAFSGTLFSPFVYEADGMATRSQFHIGYDVVIYGKVNRDIIMQTVRRRADECNDDKEKGLLKYLIEHATLIAWSEID